MEERADRGQEEGEQAEQLDQTQGLVAHQGAKGVQGAQGAGQCPGQTQEGGGGGNGASEDEVEQAVVPLLGVKDLLADHVAIFCWSAPSVESQAPPEGFIYSSVLWEERLLHRGGGTTRV